MDILEAVNIVLRHATIGTVNQIASGDAAAEAAEETITLKRKEILRHGFDFNTTTTDLLPDSSKDNRVPVSRSDLRLYLPRGLSTRRHSDGNLYIWDDDLKTWRTTTVRDVRRITDVTEFQDIPDDTAQWIAWAAAGDMYVSQRNADRPSAWIVQQMRDAEANAWNGQDRESLLTAPGVAVSEYPMGPYAVQYGGRWVVVG